MKDLIGKRVEHEEYGLGTIAFLDYDHSYLVIFDNSHCKLHDGNSCHSAEISKKYPDRKEKCLWFSNINKDSFTKIFDSDAVRLIPRRPRRSRGW